MKKQVAIVRGPNLNAWEMQNFSPLMNRYDLVGCTTRGHNFDTSSIPFEIREFYSCGQAVRARFLRHGLDRIWGDHHDMVGLERFVQNVDIVHSAETSYYCTYQAALARKRGKCKLVITVWENIPFLLNHPATRRIKSVVFENADLILAVSRRAREALILEGAPPEKIEVHMPGIDIGHFRPMGKDPGLLKQFGCTDQNRIVLFVANLYREKGIFDLLYAFRRVLDRSHDSGLRLLIAGKGRDEMQVRSLISQLGLGDSARLIGTFPYDVMPKVHNLADVFVLPSIPIETWQEQFGYVLVESMACGKPVISTNSGSIPEVVGNAGTIVAPADFSGLADALTALLTDERAALRYGQEGRSRAESTFALAVVSDRLDKYYSRLTN